MGRYIFTAIPRTADGAEIEKFDLEQQIAVVEDSLRKWEESQPEITQMLSHALREPQKYSGTSPMAVFGRAFSEIGYKVRYWQVKQKLKSRYRSQATELESLFKRKRTLQRQVATLTLARRLLSLWHMIHIPIGVALFSTAFVHMIGAIYYATLLQ